MSALVWAPLLLQLAVPLGLLRWVAFGRHRSRLAWVLTSALGALYLAAIVLAGLWLVLPWYLPLVYGALWVWAVLHSRNRARTRWPGDARDAVAAGTAALLILPVGAMFGAALAARQPPPGAVDLVFPLRGGPYMVANGGNAGLVNAHLALLEQPGLRVYRGQSHGVDLVRVNRAGFRAAGWPLPADPAAYFIFNDPVYAPCSGRVVAARDGLADRSPPARDRAHLAGNYVLLGCRGLHVLLGHLRQGSVLVKRGDPVAVGDPLARVGNTGNTDEPHLHIHAQTPGTDRHPLAGDPVPVRFGGEYLVRNSIITNHDNHDRALTRGAGARL